jgi:hypothetical protein
MLRLRKSVDSLTAAERANLIAAIKALKASGKYDQYINEHQTAMNQAAVLPGEPNDPNFRNIAHRGPAFGPWHRELLRRFELDLQAEVPGVTLPYWDWAADSALANPEAAPIWQSDLMGGDGDPNNGGQVSTGPFKFDANDPNTWRVVTTGGDPGPGLSRTLGQGGHLPTQSEIDTVANITPYDAPPWRTTSNPSFRNSLEGWNPATPNLHNNVHVWVGGSMLPGTSPNDPVFFLHHCNVDRLWWQWQQNHPDAGYLPTSAGPPGHNLNDQMSPWDAATTPASVLDIHKIGYTYDTDPPMKLSLVIDRSTFGQDEVAALAGGSPSPGNPAVVPDAFWVMADGFTPNDLQLNAGNLANPPLVPAVALSPTPTGMTLTFVGPVVPEDPSLPPVPQRFRFRYQVSFTSTAAFGFAGDDELLTLTANTAVSGVDYSASGLVELVKQANPFLLDGPTPWLSIDLRVFKVPAGAARFGVTMGPDAAVAPGFIQNVIQALNNGHGTAGGESYESGLPVDENTSALELAPTDSGGHAVFDFAVARVRMRGLTEDAANARVFFRLFAAQTTNTSYDPATSYRRFSDGVTGGHAIALTGTRNGEYITIPCFATARVDTTAVSMTTQTDPPNVQTIVHDPGGTEIQAYYGCWLDINQPAQPVLPQIPPANPDGPFAGTLQSIQRAIVRSPHQCLVAEIAFDPVAIPAGVDPSTTDKLAQRNLAFVSIPNPGQDGSRRAPQPFEMRPTPSAIVKADLGPDELMIDWLDVPAGSTAQIYLPGIDAGTLLDLAGRRDPTHRLNRIDAHTIGCPAETVTYVPIPAGAKADHAGLLTVDIPPGVRRGEQYTVIVRQITSVQAYVRPRRQEPALQEVAAGGQGELVRWRRVFGAFQVTIPVHTKAILLPGEERKLSILRWIQEGIAPGSRWYDVFQRYLDQIAGRVGGLGGDPGDVQPSPTGDWHGPKPSHGGPHGHATGKVVGIVYDRYGDFEGFLLDTPQGERHYSSREDDMACLIEKAWRERLRITVVTESHEPGRPQHIILREPPACRPDDPC